MTGFIARVLVGLVGIGALAAVGVADEIEIVSTIPGEFVDISATGTDLQLDEESEAEITTTIGNALLPAGRVIVANNGGIGFNPPDTNLPPENTELPNSEAMGGGQMLLAYWDDIGNDIGGVLWQQTDNRVIVQWEDRQVELAGRTAFVTFQIQVFDGSEVHNPYFQFIYQEIDGAGGGASATIGYQDGGAGYNDATWSFNTPGAVGNGTVLTALPEPTSAALWLGSFACALRRRG